MSWIQTYTGRKFDVLRPRTDDVDDDVQTVVYGSFTDKPPDWGDDLVKQADWDILGSEAEWLMVDEPLPEWKAPPADPKLMPQLNTECSPKEAERLFHARFDELTRRMQR